MLLAGSTRYFVRIRTGFPAATEYFFVPVNKSKRHLRAACTFDSRVRFARANRSSTRKFSRCPGFEKKACPPIDTETSLLLPSSLAGDRLGLVATEKRKEKKSVNSLTLFVTPFAGDRLGLVATEKKRKYPSIGSSFSSNN